MDSAELDGSWNFSDPAASEKKFRQIGTPEALTQVARALGLQGRLEEATRILDEIEPTEPLVQARAALERGRLHNDVGDKERAVDCFRDALRIAQQIEAEYYAIDAMHMIAICDNSVESHRAALRMAERAIEPRARSWDGSLLNNLGWTLFEQRELDAALDTFNEAVRRRENNGQAERIHIAKWCVARTLRELTRSEEALEVLHPLVSLDKKDGFVFDEIAENYLQMGNLEAARPYFAQAALLLPSGDGAALRREELGRGAVFAELSIGTVSLTRDFGNLINDAWHSCVDFEELSSWLGTVKPIYPNVGETRLAQGLVFDLLVDNDPSDVIRCEVLEYEERRSLALRWNNSKLCIRTEHSTLTLVHEDIDNIATYAAAWHSALDLLKHLLAKGRRESFTENFDALLPQYQRFTSQILNPGTQ